MQTYYVYRLFDAACPGLTVYVGQTTDIERRSKAHRNASHGGTLVRAWCAWMKNNRREVGIEVIEVVTGSEDDIYYRENHWIAAHAVNNPQLLNARQWKQDKVRSGVPSGVVEAYALSVNGRRMEPLDAITLALESEYPRLRFLPRKETRKEFKERVNAEFARLNFPLASEVSQ